MEKNCANVQNAKALTGSRNHADVVQQLNDDDTRPYICPLCKVVTYGRRNLYEHVRVHSKPRKKTVTANDNCVKICKNKVQSSNSSKYDKDGLMLHNFISNEKSDPISKNKEKNSSSMRGVKNSSRTALERSCKGRVKAVKNNSNNVFSCNGNVVEPNNNAKTIYDKEFDLKIDNKASTLKDGINISDSEITHSDLKLTAAGTGDCSVALQNSDGKYDAVPQNSEQVLKKTERYENLEYCTVENSSLSSMSKHSTQLPICNSSELCSITSCTSEKVEHLSEVSDKNVLENINLSRHTMMSKLDSVYNRKIYRKEKRIDCTSKNLKSVSRKHTRLDSSPRNSKLRSSVNSLPVKSKETVSLNCSVVDADKHAEMLTTEAAGSDEHVKLVRFTRSRYIRSCKRTSGEGKCRKADYKDQVKPPIIVSCQNELTSIRGESQQSEDDWDSDSTMDYGTEVDKPNSQILYDEKYKESNGFRSIVESSEYCDSESGCESVQQFVCPLCEWLTVGQKGLYEHVRDNHSSMQWAPGRKRKRCAQRDIDLKQTSNNSPDKKSDNASTLCSETSVVKGFSDIADDLEIDLKSQSIDVSTNNKKAVCCKFCLKMIKIKSCHSYSDHLRYHKKNGLVCGDVSDAKANSIYCPICFKYLPITHERSFLFHIYNHGRPPKNRPSVIVPDGEPRRCKFCDAVYSTKSDMMKHMKTHVVERRYICETCGSAFFKSDTLKKHIMLRHTGEKPYMCEKCGITRSSYACYLRHLKSHVAEVQSFHCSACPASFKLEKSLNHHSLIHLDESRKCYRCGTCGVCFGIMSKLRLHERSHTGEKPFKCKTCGKKSFKSRAELRQHMRVVHSIECRQQPTVARQPYVEKTQCVPRPRGQTRVVECEICNKVLPTKSQLAVHLRVHGDMRPFQCENCDKSFRRKDNLMAHRRSRHRETLCDGDVTFKCPICAVELSYKQVLQRHMKTHGVDNYLKCDTTYTCEVCKEMFVGKTRFKRHPCRRYLDAKEEIVQE